MIVCSCRAVSDRTLRDAARAGRSREEILAATGVGGDCGCCREEVEAILAAPTPCRASPCAGCPRRAVAA